MEKEKDNMEKEVKVVEKISCAGLENKFLLVKVGDEHRPATNEDIEEIQEKLEDLFDKNNINCLAFVTHHAISMDIL